MQDESVVLLAQRVDIFAKRQHQGRPATLECHLLQSRGGLARLTWISRADRVPYLLLDVEN